MPDTIAVGVGIEEMNPGKPQFILDLIAKTTDLLGCPNPAGKEDIRILQTAQIWDMLFRMRRRCM